VNRLVVVHRYTLGLHSPAMDVAFQMQGMPKIASMVSECTPGPCRNSRKRVIRVAADDDDVPALYAEPRGAFGPSLLVVTNEPICCDTHASLSCLITSATPPPPACVYHNICCCHKTEAPLSF
jgi:hypothetical protein